MEAKQINQLRYFEKIVVSKIIADYNVFLNDQIKSNLTNETVIPDDYEHTFTGPDNIQGVVIRTVLEKVFNKIICKKEIEFSNGEKKNVKYGNYLKKGLVNYYASELATKNNIRIDMPDNSEESLEIISRIKQNLGSNFDSLVFNCDAIAVLNASNSPDLLKKCEQEAVKLYITEKKIFEETNSRISSEPTKVGIKVYPPVYKEGILYINYVDDKGVEGTFKPTNPKIVIEVYNNMCSKLNNDEEIDGYDFFQEIRKHGEIAPIYIDDTNKSKLSSKELNLLNSFYTDRDTLFNSQVPSNNPESEPIESVLLEEYKNVKLISEEEYQALCMRTINPLLSPKLTDIELKQMEYYDKVHYQKDGTPKDENEIKLVEENKNNMELKLKPSNNNQKTGGFAQTFLPVILSILVIFIGIIVGITLFKIKN